ncbi:MAG: ATP-binding protein [Acidobacteriales bacterium]|nr:ATP-binding protein [Terriglobales bacterium]
MEADPKKTFAAQTGVPDRYRSKWPFPQDLEWLGRMEKIKGQTHHGGMAVLIGPRGTGKTRLAAEAMRYHPCDGILLYARYTTAMGLFLRLRATYGGQSEESENDIVEAMATAPILTIDEIQERGHTAWEDRLLTHIIDRRYGAMLPTILIANLTIASLAECLGESIVSRIQETGGIIRVEGQSHRRGA